MPKPVFMKPGMYIMAHEPISTAYFINPTHQSVCLHVCPPSFLGNGSVKNVTVATNELLEAFYLYAIRAVSKESRKLFLPRIPGLVLMASVAFFVNQEI
jgi:hypothetical protein